MNIQLENHPLSDRHWEEWQASAVEIGIVLRNAWTINDAQELDRLLNRNSKPKSRWKHSKELVPGWAVAGVDPATGERIFKGAQFKPDNPQIDPKTGKSRKYLSPSNQTLAPLFLEMGERDYWRQVHESPQQAIVITEGAKKAGAVLSRGIPCISIPGVATGGKLGRLRPELEYFARYGRPFYLAFDRDIIEKRAVRNAQHNLGRMLKERGGCVYVCSWRNDLKGIDDYLADGGDMALVMESAQTIEQWRDSWDVPEADDIEPCRLSIRYRQVESAVGDRLRWNELKGAIELDESPLNLDELRLYLALKHNADIPKADCETILPILAKRQTHNPIRDYLHSCQAMYEYEPELLNGLAKQFLGTESVLHSSYLKKTLIAAVGRAMTPGCKLDTVCILTGRQGVGKSTFWKTLASEQWFDDSVGSASDKDERIKLHQSWFIEWSELETIFRRKDVSSCKAFITTQVDKLRVPYGKHTEDFPRPSVIVGTTNEHEFLADPTGSRRFWVIPVLAASIPIDLLARERDRIWAAATHAYFAGERWDLSMDERRQSAIENQDYQASDPWEDAILEYCEGLLQVTTPEILQQAVHVDIENQDKRSQMRVANLLKANGWRSARRSAHGRKQRVWILENSEEKVGQVVPEASQTTIHLEGQPKGQPKGQPQDNLSQKGKKEPSHPEKGCSGDNRDNRDNLLSESLKKDEPVFRVGDTVAITTGVHFYGKHCVIESLGDNQAIVRAPGWVVPHSYTFKCLKLVKSVSS